MNFQNIPLDHHFIPSVNKGMTSGHKLMIVLHGRGDTLDSYKTLTSEINVTGLNYLLLNAPFTESFGYTWYDDSFDLMDHRYKESLKKLKGVLSSCLGAGFSQSDIFLFGFSQGARMVLDFFLHEDKRFAGVVALSPRMSHFDPFPKLNNLQSDTPLFVAHGLYDPIIPFQETSNELISWQNQMKNVIFESYEMAHEIDILEIQKVRQWLNDYL
jgi:phospholipase/carboxylesterase